MCRQVPPLGSEERLLGLALTGQDLPLEGDLVAALAAQGWEPEDLHRLRLERQRANQPWPFPVPLDAIREVGFARFDARLAQVRHDLGLTGLVPSAPAQRNLDADERRLTADRPPHW